MQLLVDELICPMQLGNLNVVGAWYEDLSQTEDAEVHTLLKKYKEYNMQHQDTFPVARQFIEKLNEKIAKDINVKFFVLSHLTENTYACTYVSTEKEALQIQAWLQSSAIDAEITMDYLMAWCIKIDRIDAFPDNFFTLDKLNEQQANLLRLIKKQNNTLKIFSDAHIKKFLAIVMQSFVAVNYSAELANTKKTDTYLNDVKCYADCSVMDFLNKHAKVSQQHHNMLVSYYATLSTNLTIFENSLLSPHSIYTFVVLNSGYPLKAMEVVFEKMSTYGVYSNELIRTINRNIELILFIAKENSIIHSEKFATVLSKLSQVNRICEIVNSHLKFLSEESWNVQMIFVAELNLMQKNKSHEIQMAEESFKTTKEKCKQQLMQMNVLLDQLQVEVKNILHARTSSEIQSQPKLTSNPRMFSTPHEVVLRNITKIIPHEERHKYKYFDQAINDKKYERALRTACNSSLGKAFKLVKLLLMYKGILKINIDEQAGDKCYSALHYAAIKGNKDIYDLLVHFRAKQLPDKEGNMPEDLLPKERFCPNFK